MNFPKCSDCNRTLIEEEIKTHECRRVIDYRIEDDILWLFDGEQWYPRKLRNNRSFTSDKTIADWTEPLKQDKVCSGEILCLVEEWFS